MTELIVSPKIKLKRRILFLKGLCIGIVTGLIAIGFRLCLDLSENLRYSLNSFSISHSYYFLPSLVFCFCIGLTLYVLLKIAPEASGSGIPHLKGCLKDYYVFRPWRILLVKFVGGILSIGSGLALGREGPTIQMGGSIGKIIGNYLCSHNIERKLLIAASAGAGLSAAFNAPLAGIVFVIEELENNFNQLGLVTAFAACVSSDIVCRLIMGQLPIFHVEISYYPEIEMFPLFIALGVFSGVIGFIFNKSLNYILDKTQRLNLLKKIILGLFVGIICGVIIFFEPDMLGTGTKLMENLLDKHVAQYNILAFFVIRFILTIISYSTAAPGGIFSPLLLLGALSGSFFGNTVLNILPNLSLNTSVWGVLGMAGLFSAIVRAPVTGIILILEMTNEHYMLLPLIIVSIVSYSIPEFFKDLPIYEALLHRDLKQRKIKNI